MADAFEVGDAVQLKGGGPSMTVERIEKDEVLCSWPDGKKIHEKIFAAGALKKSGPSSGVVTLVRG
jgi:uncharacterized protein YodC (DUF2158 family)